MTGTRYVGVEPGVCSSHRSNLSAHLYYNNSSLYIQQNPSVSVLMVIMPHGRKRDLSVVTNFETD